ncbi:MAG TPA: hypothetical protein VEY92_08620 [Pseudoxanthomonas sp.]|nr:hypothetical protein [Pseudoxanthomonas sp.]
MTRPDWTATMCRCAPHKPRWLSALHRAAGRFEDFLIDHIVAVVCGCVMLMVWLLLAFTLIVGKWP